MNRTVCYHIFVCFGMKSTLFTQVFASNILRSPYIYMIYKQIFCSLLLITAAFNFSCSAQRNNDPLASLRDLTKDGKLPAESVVADVERRYAGQQTAVLARLLRARIKFE